MAPRCHPGGTQMLMILVDLCDLTSKRPSRGPKRAPRGDFGGFSIDFSSIFHRFFYDFSTIFKRPQEVILDDFAR